jgi:hypothetical protein
MKIAAILAAIFCFKKPDAKQELHRAVFRPAFMRLIWTASHKIINEVPGSADIFH